MDKENDAPQGYQNGDLGSDNPQLDVDFPITETVTEGLYQEWVAGRDETDSTSSQ